MNFFDQERSAHFRVPLLRTHVVGIDDVSGGRLGDAGVLAPVIGSVRVSGKTNLSCNVIRR